MRLTIIERLEELHLDYHRVRERINVAKRQLDSEKDRRTAADLRDEIVELTFRMAQIEDQVTHWVLKNDIF